MPHPDKATTAAEGFPPRAPRQRRCRRHFPDVRKAAGAHFISLLGGTRFSLQILTVGTASVSTPERDEQDARYDRYQPPKNEQAAATNEAVAEVSGEPNLGAATPGWGEPAEMSQAATDLGEFFVNGIPAPEAVREVPPATPLPWSPWREAFGSSGGLITMGKASLAPNNSDDPY